MNASLFLSFLLLLLPCLSYGQLQRAECTKNRHCRKQNEFCVVDIETCMQYSIEDNGYTCDRVEQCQKIDGDGVTCFNNTCTCPGEYDVLFNNKCYTGIGATCRKQSDCEIPQSDCTEKSCQCIETFELSSDSTYCGLSCDDEEPDCPEGSSCESGVCRCGSDLVTLFLMDTNATSMGCYPYASKDNDYSCQSDLQCSTLAEDATCDLDNNQCKCGGGQVLYDGKCGAGLHDKCSILGDACVLPNTECSDGECVCSKESRESDDHSSCINLSCVKHEECQQRDQAAICVQGQCTCDSGYVLRDDRFECLPSASSSDNYACEIDGQCQHIKDGVIGHATCSNTTNECGCKDDGNVIYKDECVLGIGGSCKILLVIEKECPIPYSECGLTSCKCESKLKASDRNDACGLKCSGDAPEHGTCVNGIWECEPGYARVFLESNTKMICMPHAKESEGYQCEYKEQCETIEEGDRWQNGNLTCLNGACVCQAEGFAIEDNKCVRGIDAYCFLPLIQCTMKNTVCNVVELQEPGILDGRCSCNWGYKANDNNTACEPWGWRMNLTCPKHAYRNELQECVCAEGYVKIENLLRDECVPVASAKDDFACEDQLQCEHIVDDSSGTRQQVQCPARSNKCTCVQDTWVPVELDGGAQCVPGIGSGCSNDSDCGISNSRCGSDNTCVCDEGMITIPDMHNCAPSSAQENDYACKYDEQCVHIPDSSASYLGIGIMDKSATCNTEEGRCGCKDPNFVIYMENGSPTCEQGLYGSCSNDFSCRSVKNAKCRADKDGNDVCQCKEGYVLPPYEMTCIPYGTPDNDFACDGNIQCSNIEDEYDNPGDTALCNQSSKKCTCRASDWFIVGPNTAGQLKCAREIDATCSRNEDCWNYIQNSDCENHQCVCKSGYYDDGTHKKCNSGADVMLSSMLTIVVAYLLSRMAS